MGRLFLFFVISIQHVCLAAFWIVGVITWIIKQTKFGIMHRGFHKKKTHLA